MTMTRWSAAAAVAVALAGCGDDGLDKEALADRANEICVKYAEQGRELGSPDLADPAQAEEYFGRASELAQQQQDELEALDPVEDLADEFDRLTAATAKATALLGDLAAAASDGDRARTTDLVQDLPPLSAEVDEAAGEIGAGSCAGA